MNQNHVNSCPQALVYFKGRLFAIVLHVFFLFGFAEWNFLSRAGISCNTSSSSFFVKQLEERMESWGGLGAAQKSFSSEIDYRPKS